MRHPSRADAHRFVLVSDAADVRELVREDQERERDLREHPRHRANPAQLPAQPLGKVNGPARDVGEALGAREAQSGCPGPPIHLGPAVDRHARGVGELAVLGRALPGRRGDTKAGGDDVEARRCLRSRRIRLAQGRRPCRQGARQQRCHDGPEDEEPSAHACRKRSAGVRQVIHGVQWSTRTGSPPSGTSQCSGTDHDLPARSAHRSRSPHLPRARFGARRLDVGARALELDRRSARTR